MAYLVITDFFNGTTILPPKQCNVTGYRRQHCTLNPYSAEPNPLPGVKLPMFCHTERFLIIQMLDVVKCCTCRQAKDADGKFCLGKRCQRQLSADHIYV